MSASGIRGQMYGDGPLGVGVGVESVSASRWSTDGRVSSLTPMGWLAAWVESDA